MYNVQSRQIISFLSISCKNSIWRKLRQFLFLGMVQKDHLKHDKDNLSCKKWQFNNTALFYILHLIILIDLRTSTQNELKK